ncbi:MAG: tyrosine protein phosphatase [Thermoleophilaceae bacterium]
MGRVDLHFHLLPGLDDGPATVEESVEMAAAAEREGTTTIVATPHVRPDFLIDVSDLGDRVREVEERLRAHSIAIAVCRGAELGHTMVGRLLQHELETIALGPPGARWLLVEAPFGGLGDDYTSATDELRDRGFAVVVAHPERAAGALEDGQAALRHELDCGSLLQVNSWSLAGRHGGETHEAAERLIKTGRAAVLASDAHGGWRMPALSLGVECAAAAGLSPASAARLVDANPRRLIERGLPLTLGAGR